jgi:hypothetical protein
MKKMARAALEPGARSEEAALSGARLPGGAGGGVGSGPGGGVGPGGAAQPQQKAVKGKSVHDAHVEGVEEGGEAEG